MTAFEIWWFYNFIPKIYGVATGVMSLSIVTIIACGAVYGVYHEENYENLRKRTKIISVVAVTAFLSALIVYVVIPAPHVLNHIIETSYSGRQ